IVQHHQSEVPLSTTSETTRKKTRRPKIISDDKHNQKANAKTTLAITTITAPT
ncbi:11300_t:CDS:1, partial [Dentiscutata heterogama]